MNQPFPAPLTRAAKVPSAFAPATAPRGEVGTQKENRIQSPAMNPRLERISLFPIKSLDAHEPERESHRRRPARVRGYSVEKR